MVEYIVIEDAARFRAACEALAAGTGPVAVDVERASGFRYSQRAYLIQVFRRDAGVFLFDPTTIEDFSPLQEAIGETEWVFHAASQDLPSLRERGLEPPVIFDTELGSRLLGHERVGLGAVVEQTLGITLAKAHSAADWSTRPLPASWLEYAGLDVEHLVDVRDVLVAELDEQGKTEFARQEFQAVLDREPKPPRDDPWRRLSGLHTVRGRRSLAVAVVGQHLRQTQPVRRRRLDLRCQRKHRLDRREHVSGRQRRRDKQVEHRPMRGEQRSRPFQKAS